jgi:hypothetical protein
LIHLFIFTTSFLQIFLLLTEDAHLENKRGYEGEPESSLTPTRVPPLPNGLKRGDTGGHQHWNGWHALHWTELQNLAELFVKLTRLWAYLAMRKSPWTGAKQISPDRIRGI